MRMRLTRVLMTILEERLGKDDFSDEGRVAMIRERVMIDRKE